MPLTLDTTEDLLQSLADRLGCSASDVVLYLAGYQEYIPSRDSDRTFGAIGQAAVRQQRLRSVVRSVLILTLAYTTKIA